MYFPKVALILPALALLLFGAVLYTTHGVPNQVPGMPSVIMPSDVKFDLGHKHLKGGVIENVSKGAKAAFSKAADLLAPEANAATVTATPGYNITNHDATTDLGVVTCNFATAKVCRVYVSGSVATLKFINGIDGGDYTVIFNQDGTGHAIAVPTTGGGITASAWPVGLSPLLGAVTAPTQQASASIIWHVTYDSSVPAFMVYSIN